MRLRRHLTYANVMATIAVFGVVAGGGAYAVSKIDTPDIANRAITAKKLDSKAVKTSKLSGGAVTADKLADGAVENRTFSQSAPVALAGVVAYQSGGVRVFSWFDRLTDERPILERRQTGVYDLHIPGLEGAEARFGYRELLSSVNLTDDGTGQGGEISTSWSDCSGGGCLHPVIRTFDSSGTPADRGFVYLLYRADHLEP